MNKTLASLALCAVLAVPLAGCSAPADQSYDSAVKTQRAEAARKLDESIANQKKTLTGKPWASKVTQLQLDESGTKLYILTKLETGTTNDEMAQDICRSYAPAVANFPDITLLIVGDKTNTEIARCSVQRMVSDATGSPAPLETVSGPAPVSPSPVATAPARKTP